MRRAAPLLAGALACLGVGPGCGASAQTAGDRIPGPTLTVYSSAPLHGASSAGARAVVNGELMALARVHGRIGRYQIAFRSLDDSTVQRGGWDPGTTTIDARTAALDPSAIGYLGEFDSGASAISIPILERAGIVQVSATNTAVGLTSAGPGASPGEPQKYYPSGTRTYARVVPNDAVQAEVQVALQKARGCTRSFVLEDGDVDGAETASTFQHAAEAARLPLAGVQAYDPLAGDYTALALSVARTRADCVLISADPQNRAALVTREIAAALPRAALFATAGLAEDSFTVPSAGGIPASIAPRMLITVAALAADAYPPSGRAFLVAYRRRYGAPEPYAIYGYEAMSLLLDAIDRATRGGRRPLERSRVRAALFATRDRHSVLGTYSIEPSGDTTLGQNGAFRVAGGRLAFWKVVGG